MLRRSLLALLLLASLAVRPVFAASIVIVNTDPAGTGLNDPTPAAPVGGNAGTTVGQQRLIVFQQAAAIWGGLLTSTVPIRVSASFAPLDCNATTATLGATGANEVFSDFVGAPVAGTWYVKALANKLMGSDIDSPTTDMTAQFNSRLGQAGCFTGTSFYLGLDNNHGSNVNFLTVALHEFAHGLGFASFADQSGAFLDGTPAIFERFIYDDTLGQTWDMLTDAQRAVSAVNTGNLTWSGTAANAFAASYLGKRQRLLVTAPTAAAGVYSVAKFPFGAALASPGVTAQLVAATDASDAAGPSTTDGCSAITSSVSGKLALVDRGSCNFTVKVKNAQNAGAIGAIIADNITEGLDAFSPAGTDATITIPAVLVTMSDGATLRANLPASANLGVDATLLAGADTAGRMLLFAPNPYQGGGSVSHFDTSAFPNLLLEPFISDDLPIGVDATLPLFTDIGWFAGTSGPTTNYLLPSSAHVNGKNGAFYTTDLTIANRGTTDANLTLQFLGHDRDGTAGPKQLRALATNRAVTYGDILASVFGVTASDAQNFGAILITADSASLKIVSQTSTPQPPQNGTGTFGQSVPAQGANDFVTPASPKSLVGLRDDTAFRTNAFFANATTSSVTVTLTLLAGDGSTFGTTTLTLPPLGMTQINNVVTTLGAPLGTTNAVLVVSTATAGAQVATYAAVIDNNTNDPRTILP